MFFQQGVHSFQTQIFYLYHLKDGKILNQFFIELKMKHFFNYVWLENWSSGTIYRNQPKIKKK